MTQENGLDVILQLVREKAPRRMVVSGQEDPHALRAITLARDWGWVMPVFLGEALCSTEGEDSVLMASEGIDPARKEALRWMEENEADLWLDTGPWDTPFVTLLTRRIMSEPPAVLSYVTVFSAPKDGKLTLFTDTLIQGNPGIEEKVQIVKNGLKVAARLGMDRPLVAALAPLEKVNPALSSALDAALLSKMSERGQFGSAVLEGPLAMDNAESAAAARHKGIVSPVPGNVDMYLFPDLESGHHTAQFLRWAGGCQTAGLVTGTSVPLVTRSPLESADSWIFNIALGLLGSALSP